MIGSVVIYILSLIVMAISLLGIGLDYNHCEGYAIVFTFFSITGVFGLIQYTNIRREL
jgi:hypothetical protein